MTGFAAFFRKELLELSRSGRLVLLGILFVFFGILNVATAKLLPSLMKMLADTLENSGLAITEYEVTALQAWEQFFKNFSTLLIIVIIAFANVFAKEYNKGTLIPLVTKGLSTGSIAAAKLLMVQLVWFIGYGIYFGVTYAYTIFYWNNSVTQHLFAAVGFSYLFGAFLLAAMLFLASYADSVVVVLLGTGGIYLILSLLSLIPQCKNHIPTSLANGMTLLNGAQMPRDTLSAALIAASAAILLTAVAIACPRKKI